MEVKRRHVGAALLVVALVAFTLSGCAGTDPLPSRTYEAYDFTGCKSHIPTVESAGDGRTEACIQYEYDGVCTLSLTHMNAACNCGAVSAGADIEFPSWSLIRIEEWEEVEIVQTCICLYDIVYRISPVPPGVYRVMVQEPYLNYGDEPFDFELDLGVAGSGEVCLPRSGYPW